MATTYDGSIRINTKINDTGFNSSVKGMVNNTKSLNGSMKSVNTSMGGLIKTATKLGAVMLAAFAVKKIIEVGKEATKLASDLQEVQNVVDVSFGDMSSKMEEFADTAIESFGMSELTAKQTGSTFMAMGVGMGLARDSASDMAISMTGLTGDMASFFNVSQDIAKTALSSVWSGETESLKRFGVVMTEANLNEFALAQGINKTVAQMGQAEKTTLRYQFVMKSLNLAQGDFLKTQDSWANQTRILSERWKELLGIIGTGLITVLTPVLKFLNNLVQTLIDVSTSVGDILSKTFGIDVQTTASTGTTSVDTSGYDDATSAIEDTTAAQDGLTDATDATAKAAKNAVAPFDDISVLQQDTTDSSDTALTDTEATTAATQDGVKANDQLANAMAAIIDKAKELKDIFTSGFFDGLGDYKPRLDKLKEGFSSIKESLKNIFTDSEVVSAFDGLLDTLAFAAGQIAGSVASIGLSIAANLVGGLAKFLEENQERIKEFLINMFDITSEVYALVGEWFSAIAYIAEAFASDDGIRITSNFIGIISEFFMGVTELIAKLTRDILSVFLQPIIDNKEALRIALEGWYGVFADILGTIKDAFAETWDKVNEIYDKHLKPFFDSVASGLSDIAAVFLDVWTKYIQPVLEYIAERFDSTMKEHIQPFVDEFLELFGEVVDYLKFLWDDILKPITEWLIKTLGPVVGVVLKEVADAFFDAVNTIADFLTGLLKILKGLIQFVTGVLSGDWEEAWDGMVNVLVGVYKVISSIANSILDVIEALVNGVIAGINLAIGALNSLTFSIPSWVPLLGGNSFGLNIPSIPRANIPRLAEGAVIQPNQEFLAVLGDQRNGVNIETPLTTMVDAFKTALGTMNFSGGGNTGTLILELDGKALARGQIPYTNAETSRIGVKLIQGGA